MKTNYFSNYILFFSVAAVFMGELYVYHLNNYLERELSALAQTIDAYYENTGKTYKADEIKTLMEGYNHGTVNFPYNNSRDHIAISDFSRAPGKPLLEITLSIREDAYHIQGITQTLGIPGMRYDSRKKTVDRDSANEFYLLWGRIPRNP